MSQDFVHRPALGTNEEARGSAPFPALVDRPGFLCSTPVERDRPVRSARERAILDRVRATPEGFVRTYGDISPGAPRVAGAVLHACDEPGLPWHRIVRADGSLAMGEKQRRRLEAEGVPFKGTRVDMRVARMIPEGLL